MSLVDKFNIQVKQNFAGMFVKHLNNWNNQIKQRKEL